VPVILQPLISFRCDLSADAGAVELTGDPEGYIRMLAKQTARSAPALWSGRAAGRPSVRFCGARRIAAVASRSGIERSRADELIREAQADLRGEPAEGDDRYDLSALLAPRHSVYTDDLRARYKRRAAMRSAVPVTLLAVPIIFAGCALADRIPAVWALSFFGQMAFLFAIVIYSARAAGTAAMPAMRRSIEPALQARYGVAMHGMSHVGYSPGSELRVYSGDTSWDAGFIAFSPDRMVFLGDASHFELRPEQVAGSNIRYHRLGVGGAMPLVYVTWRESPSSPEQTFSLEMRDARRRSAGRRMAEDTQRTIEWWRSGMAVPARADAAPAGLGLPDPGDSAGLPPPATWTALAAAILAIATGITGAALVAGFADWAAGPWLLSPACLLGILLIGIAIVSVADSVFESALILRRGRRADPAII